MTAENIVSTESRPTKSRRGEGAKHTAKYKPPRYCANEYSQEHAASIALMDDFWPKLAAQEEMYVDAGFPAEGLTDFLCRWFQAWENRDVAQLRECWADDIVYAEPSGGSRDYVGTELELIHTYNVIFKLAPDMVFYPQNAAQKSLPYYDFLDGKVRIAVPWRMVAKFRLAPRAVNVVGMDRYDMIRDPQRGWLIQRIDTDGDFLGTLTQMLPFVGFNGMSQKTARRLARLVLRIRPSWRAPTTRPFTADLV